MSYNIENINIHYLNTLLNIQLSTFVNIYICIYLKGIRFVSLYSIMAKKIYKDNTHTPRTIHLTNKAFNILTEEANKLDVDFKRYVQDILEHKAFLIEKANKDKK